MNDIYPEAAPKKITSFIVFPARETGLDYIRYYSYL